MIGYTTNIEKETLDNTAYRRVLFTGKKMQLVVMTLRPQEDIPLETHPDTDQFIRVEKGEALVKIGSEENKVSEDEMIIIPAGNAHYVKNTSTEEDLKIYTLYSPPEHPEGTVQQTKAEADAAEKDH
ncbi:MAG: cupin domain-containing protein [Candidatus Diapherotrites archaeon]|nr:cupin domain-containing protein [Candidatus Diapherotrites archaeon]MDZ4255995.1 cupin domain-containing protein [archaeon]